MAKGAKIPTVESESLSIAAKRAMAARDIETPALAKESGVPYGALRRIPELDAVADCERLQKIATALRMPLSRIIADAGRLAQDPEIQAGSVSTAGARRPVDGADEGPATTAQVTDDLIDRIAAHPEDYDVAANEDQNKTLEAETPRD